MSKEIIKEFRRFFVIQDGDDLDAAFREKIEQFWLSKLKAQRAELLEGIGEIREQCKNCGGNTIWLDQVLKLLKH